MSGPPEPIAEFPVRVTIRKVETGEVRSYETKEHVWDGEGGWSDFWWREGNGGCDCNREPFFERAAGNEIDNERCSDGRFIVESIVRLDTGERIYAEGADA